MPFSIRFFSGCIMLCVLSLQQVTAQDAPGNSIDWYESFFQPRKRKPVEKELEQATIKLRESKRTGNKTDEVKALMETGLLHLTRAHDLETAMDFFIQALALEDSLNLNHQKIFTCLARAQVFEEVNDYVKSATLLKEAFAISEPFKDPHIFVMILNKLGRVHAKLGKLDDAF